MGSLMHRLLVLKKKNRKDRIKNSKNTNITLETKEVVLIANTPTGSKINLLYTERCKDLWIANTGSSRCITNTLQGMYNKQQKTLKVKLEAEKMWM